MRNDTEDAANNKAANETSDKDRGKLPILTQGMPPLRGASKKRPQSGMGRYRAAVLILIHVVILAHIAHFWKTGQTVSPIEPSESMYALELGYLNAGAIFFLLAILSTAIFGRFFCGWGCHIIALQDLCSYFLRRIGLRPKPLRSRSLKLVPFAAAFYMFAWPTLNRLIQQRPHPGFTNHLVTQDFWATFPGPVIAVLTFVVCGGVIVYFLGNKGFCTYACPYGAFFNVADQLAPGRIRVTDACHHCGQCTASCTSNVVVHAEVKEFGQVVDPGCMKCMDCVSACPNDALYFGFKDLSPVGAKSATDKKMPSKKKQYDFSIAEELIAIVIATAAMLSFRGLYGRGRLPLLLSIALGVLTAFLAIQIARIVKKRDFRLQNFRLKKDGRMTRTGLVVSLTIVGWLGFTIHSGLVKYYRHVGRSNLAAIIPSWPELLAGQEFQNQMSDADRGMLAVAERNFQRTDQLGLVDVLEVKMGLGYVNMMKGDTAATEKYLREAYACDPGSVRDALAEFLASQGRTQEAREILSTDQKLLLEQ